MATSAPRIAALVALAGAAVVLTVAGVSVDLTHLDAARIADRVRASGALGPLTLIALLVAQAVVAPLPSPPLLMAAGDVYGPWVGFGIGWGAPIWLTTWILLAPMAGLVALRLARRAARARRSAAAS